MKAALLKSIWCLWLFMTALSWMRLVGGDAYQVDAFFTGRDVIPRALTIPLYIAYLYGYRDWAPLWIARAVKWSEG